MTSAQCDVIVLAPGYPELLKSKKIYLIGGVVAAFECKNTLKSQHILDAIERCVNIKRLTRMRFGTPYKELHAPIIYGILSHSHVWRNERAKVVESITGKLLEVDAKFVQHPRECLDLLCISDLGTWSRSTITYMKPEWIPNFGAWDESAREKIIALYGNRGSCSSGYQESSIVRAGQRVDYTPIGAMLSHLYGTVAWDNSVLRSIADYFRIAGLDGSGGGNLRTWDAVIFSDRVRARVLNGHLSNDAWDEWSMIF